MSGLVRLRTSLQPSRFWKSSSVGSCAWSMVPIAPSATTTRVASASRSAFARLCGVTDGLAAMAMGLLPGCDGCRLCEPAESGTHVARVSGLRREKTTYSVS